MTYYVGSVPVTTSDVKHYGVIGMKWGVRRYQNEDGTLTEAGKRRYSEGGQYEYRSLGQRMMQRRTDRFDRRANRRAGYDVELAPRADGGRGYDIVSMKQAPMGKRDQARSDRNHRVLEAYKKRDADRLAYAKSITMKQAVVETLLYGKEYSYARARGASRMKAMLAGASGRTPIGRLNSSIANKKKYGAYIPD